MTVNEWQLIYQETQEKMSSRKESFSWNKLATIRIKFLQYTPASSNCTITTRRRHRQLADIPSFSCMTSSIRMMTHIFIKFITNNSSLYIAVRFFVDRIHIFPFVWTNKKKQIRMKRINYKVCSFSVSKTVSNRKSKTWNSWNSWKARNVRSTSSTLSTNSTFSTWP